VMQIRKMVSPMTNIERVRKVEIVDIAATMLPRHSDSYIKSCDKLKRV
jgi:hypothetical protein